VRPWKRTARKGITHEFLSLVFTLTAHEKSHPCLFPLGRHPKKTRFGGSPNAASYGGRLFPQPANRSRFRLTYCRPNIALTASSGLTTAPDPATSAIES
jgi:hypothetical protein